MVKYIKLSQGKEAIVDDEEYDKLNKYKWYYSHGYAVRNVRVDENKRKSVRMHRVIADTPKDKFTDHINGNKLDNRKSNLRNVNNAQNTKNAEKRASATSKYKGVFYFKRRNDVHGKWAARIQNDGKSIRLGYFDSEISAALAYNDAAIKYHKEYARLNKLELIGIHEYQDKASRTMEKEKWFNTQISNYCMGLSGETGEVIDELKKVLYHGHDIDIENIKNELGDVMWYLAAIATTLKIDLNEVAIMNVKKLEERYPEGFSNEKSINRIDQPTTKKKQG